MEQILACLDFHPQDLVEFCFQIPPQCLDDSNFEHNFMFNDFFHDHSVIKAIFSNEKIKIFTKIQRLYAKYEEFYAFIMHL
ncbi:hypothetical protein BpHYR1_006236 [Brachionus plicatilis]|uniref:Uncharacterized protein n=1 Tax=Brachionus plicatilis TaxID=10195 RepID=A0A3M7S892_BRAPC|nr:hypothetical protein BpHYR1_006236 [Brachionus plicatilis]